MDPTTDPQAYYDYLLQQQKSLEQQRSVYAAMVMGAPVGSPIRIAYQRQLDTIDSQLSSLTPQIDQYAALANPDYTQEEQSFDAAVGDNTQGLYNNYAAWAQQGIRPSDSGAFYQTLMDSYGREASDAFLQRQLSPSDYSEMYQNWQTLYPVAGTDSNAGAVIDNNAGAVTDANVGNGGAATGGTAGGGESTVGVPQGGNATTGSQTAPAGTAGTGGNTAPGAGTAGQGDYLTAPARDPNNPNDFSWMNFNKGAGGALTPPAQLPTVANSATGIVTRNANMSLTPLQQKMGGIIGKKPGMFSV